jgi:putative ABC transport system substrate-binding protein
MRRREFITLMACALVEGRPPAARAQQPAMPVIGFLGSESSALWANRVRAFHQGLREAGYVEGRNVAIEYRWAEAQNEVPALVADLMRHQVSVMVVPGSTPAALAAKAETSTIPVVFMIAFDPVQVGLVASLSRPGGNMTGVVSLNVEIAPKRLELLHELFPTATHFGLLVDPTYPPALAEPVVKGVQAVARTLGIELHLLHASNDAELDAALATAARLRAAGLVVIPFPLFNSRIEQLAALSVRYALPTVYQWREFVAAGGLLSYGSQ